MAVTLPRPDVWLAPLIDQLHARPELRDAAPLADVLDHATRDNA